MEKHEDIETIDSSSNAAENLCSELVYHIEGMLENTKPSLSSECCIYRVPEKVRKLDEEAYTPRVVSIGPFHHGKDRLKFMEASKLECLKAFLQHTSVAKLQDYVRFLKDCERRARSCYEETIDMCSDVFVTMILVDACFIIELLLRYEYGHPEDEDHFKLTTPWLWIAIRQDLILLENQLPFFVLEGIFNLFISSSRRPFPSLLELSVFFFENHNKQNKEPNFESSIKHFTDLILILYRPMMPQRLPCRDAKFESVYSATELDEAGVKFKLAPRNCLLDIQFGNGMLEIPCFKVSDKTAPLIRNLMALELCHYRDTYIIDYMLFLDYLINTPKDVDLLVQKGILVNWLGDSREVAKLFNSLCRGVTISNKNFYFCRLCEDLNAYYKVPRHRWKATFKRDYFSTPWRIASTVAAVTLLVLTFVQTVCSIISTIKGNN